MSNPDDPDDSADRGTYDLPNVARGIYIRHKREAADLTQAQLAARVMVGGHPTPVSEKTIRRWEAGRALKKWESVEALGRALYVDPEKITAKLAVVAEGPKLPSTHEQLVAILAAVTGRADQLEQQVQTLARALEDLVLETKALREVGATTAQCVEDVHRWLEPPSSGRSADA